MTNDQNNGGFHINVNSPGNLIAQTITINGGVHIGTASQETGGYSDEQIVRAICAINGKDKVLNTKQKWAGVYWLLRWAANYPSNSNDFCKKMNALPGHEQWEVACEYNNIRMLTTLSFMNQDARQINEVKPSKQDEGVFTMCREVVIALAQELAKTMISEGGI